MKKLILAWIAVITLGVVAIARADKLNPLVTSTDFNSILDVGNDAGGMSVGGFPGPFGNVNVTLVGQVATITFTGSSGFQFGGQGAVAVNVNASNFLEAIIFDPSFSAFSLNQQEDGFGNFNLTIDNTNFSTGYDMISFTVTNTGSIPWSAADQVLSFNASGFDAAAHVRQSIGNPLGLTGYAAEDVGGTTRSVPDGGRTLVLLGASMVALVGLRFWQDRRAG